MHQAGLRIEDRLFEVSLIDLHAAAIGKLFGAAVQALPSRAETGTAILAMAGMAAVLLDQLATFFQYAVPTGPGGRGQCLRKGRLAAQPLSEGGLVYHDHIAAHVVMTDAAILGTQHFILAHDSWRKPEVRHHSRHHVHLAANLRYIKIVQNIFGTQQDFHRLIDRQTNFITSDYYIVLPNRVLGVKTEWIDRINKLDIRLPQLPVLARKTKGPLPLLGDHL
ncbi:hypothetical protein D3C84_510880 [compost metagenome]